MSRVTSRTILVYSGIFTFLVDAYPTFAASALAANSFMRSSFGGIFPLFGIQSKFVLLFPSHDQSRVCASHALQDPVAGKTHHVPGKLSCTSRAQSLVLSPCVSTVTLLSITTTNGLAVYNNLGYHWATTLLAFLTLAMVPFP